VRWTDEFVKRDVFDLARCAADRLTVEVITEAMISYFAWKDGKAEAAEVAAKFEKARPLVMGLEDLLQLHGDYSIAETLDHMETVEHIRNPEFDKVLIDNASCWYCVSHQAENAKFYLTPAFEALVAEVRGLLAKGDRTAKLDSAPVQSVRRKMLAMRLAEMRPCEPRTEENGRRALLKLAEAASAALK